MLLFYLMNIHGFLILDLVFVRYLCYYHLIFIELKYLLWLLNNFYFWVLKILSLDLISLLYFIIFLNYSFLFLLFIYFSYFILTLLLVQWLLDQVPQASLSFFITILIWLCIIDVLYYVKNHYDVIKLHKVLQFLDII
jgi:hypothetical protein